MACADDLEVLWQLEQVGVHFKPIVIKVSFEVVDNFSLAVSRFLARYIRIAPAVISHSGLPVWPSLKSLKNGPPDHFRDARPVLSLASKSKASRVSGF